MGESDTSLYGVVVFLSFPPLPHFQLLNSISTGEVNMIEKEYENLYDCLGSMDNHNRHCGVKLRQAYAFIQELEHLTDELWSTRFGTTTAAIERLKRIEGLPSGNK